MILIVYPLDKDLNIIIGKSKTEYLALELVEFGVGLEVCIEVLKSLVHTDIKFIIKNVVGQPKNQCFS